MSKHRLQFEALEDRRLLSVSAYRDLTVSPLPADQAAAQTAPLFTQGDAGYAYFNIPAIVTTSAGSVLAFSEGRADTQDTASYALVVRRSTDSGDSWTPLQTVVTANRAAGEYLGNPCPIVDNVTGDVFLLYTVNNSRVFVTHSSNDGLSWTAPTEITSSVKVTAAGNPGPPGAYPNDPWSWYAVGPSHGIQLQHGDHAGRLMASADHRLVDGVSSTGQADTSFSHVIYSDDHGQTWRLGGGLSQAIPYNYNSNENTIVELNNGDLYMNIRMATQDVPIRGESTSTDGGISWSMVQHNYQLATQPVAGSLLRLNNNVLLFSCLNNPISDLRQNMTIWVSYDEGQHWDLRKTIDFGYAAYSDMTVIGPDTILLIYTRGRNGGELTGGSSSPNQITYQETALAKINLTWLQSTAPYQFEWEFNELAAGLSVPSTVPLPVAQDSGQWDQKGMIYSSTPVQYVAGMAPGNSAIRLTAGDDEVVLSQGHTTALQFDITDGYTIEMDFKTSATDGVLIGSRPTVKNWTLAMVNGHVQFSVFDSATTSAITSNAIVSDGNWHHLTAIHDFSSRRLRLFIDGKPAATSVTDTTTIYRSIFDTVEPIVLGAYNDRTQQLAVDVDRLQITRAVVNPPLISNGEVAGRYLFYAGSKFDKTNHDNAIAPDKSAYLPGTGLRATFNNITSYTRGINGIMVDLNVDHGTLTANDFIFKVGNNNSPNLWTPTLEVPSITVRPGAGVDGADRVEIRFTDANAPKNQWLEVVIKGNDAVGGFNTNSGLTTSDVFFFGSRVGDDGSGTALFALTNVIDESSTRLHTGIATITSVWDYDRSGTVSSTDSLAARFNAGSLMKINIDLPSSAPAAAPAIASEALSVVTEPGIALALAAGNPREAEKPASAFAVTFPQFQPQAISIHRFFIDPLHASEARMRAKVLAADKVAETLGAEGTDEGDSLLVHLLAGLEQTNLPK